MLFSIPNSPRTPVDTDPDRSDPRCRLLGPTALIVQALMGILVLSSLVYKRQREKPRRKWKVWMFDVSKQVIGQAILHGSNILVSYLIGRRTLKNPCVTYLMNILLDTTLGVLMIYAILHLFTYLLTEKGHLNGFQSGVYGDPPSPIWWAKQAIVYFITLLIMKTFVIIVLEIFPWLITAGNWLLSWTGGKNYLQVIFVMGFFPIVMNIIQFWLIDSIVKFQATFVEISGTSSREDEEPLFNGNDSYQDGEGDVDPRVAVVEPNPNDLESGTARIRSRTPTHPTSIPSANPDPRLKETEETSSGVASTPTSTSSRTITIKRRSPPPSPRRNESGSSSSYGSMEAPVRSPPLSWTSRTEDEDEHAARGRSFGPSSDGTAGGVGASSEERASDKERRTSPKAATYTKLESWKMPVIANGQTIHVASAR